MIPKYIQRLQARIMLNHKLFVVYTILRILVVLTAIRCFFLHNYESLMVCILSLLLFLVPTFFEEKLKIEIPTGFHINIYLFIYAAEILGEVNKYYTKIPGWDTMLHTINGFLCAAIGFSLVQVLNRGSHRLNLSPIYVALMGFCFSMTIGVLWEFFEFTGDQLFNMDMQKDFIITDISSVSLDETKSQIPVHISDIKTTTIETEDGQVYVIDGYLDIGLMDTMKDLMVNFLGAIVFSVIGYFHEKNSVNKSLPNKILIRTVSDEEIEETNRLIEEKKPVIKT